MFAGSEIRQAQLGTHHRSSGHVGRAHHTSQIKICILAKPNITSGRRAKRYPAVHYTSQSPTDRQPCKQSRLLRPNLAILYNLIYIYYTWAFLEADGGPTEPWVMPCSRPWRSSRVSLGPFALLPSITLPFLHIYSPLSLFRHSCAALHFH